MKKFNNFKEYIEDWARTPIPENLGEYHIFYSLEDFIKMTDVDGWKVIDEEKTIKSLKKLKKGRKLLKKS